MFQISSGDLNDIAAVADVLGDARQSVLDALAGYVDRS
jgi:hypothetical protein